MNRCVGAIAAELGGAGSPNRRRHCAANRRCFSRQFARFRPLPPPILHKGFRTINYSNVKSSPPPLPCPSLCNHDRNCWRELYRFCSETDFSASVMEEYRLDLGSPFRPARFHPKFHDETAKGRGRESGFAGPRRGALRRFETCVKTRKTVSLVSLAFRAQSGANRQSGVIPKLSSVRVA